MLYLFFFKPHLINSIFPGYIMFWTFRVDLPLYRIFSGSIVGGGQFHFSSFTTAFDHSRIFKTGTNLQIKQLAQHGYVIMRKMCVSLTIEHFFIFNLEGTFLVFRIMTLGWMTRWLVLHRDEVPFFAYTLGSVGKLL